MGFFRPVGAYDMFVVGDGDKGKWASFTNWLAKFGGVGGMVYLCGVYCAYRTAIATIL